MNATIHPPPVSAAKPALEAARLTSGGSVSIQHPDGFNGARDAAILEAADFEPAMGACHVQATSRTKDLLHRAGIKRPRVHEFYAVPVRRDHLNRLQLRNP